GPRGRASQSSFRIPLVFEYYRYLLPRQGGRVSQARKRQTRAEKKAENREELLRAAERIAVREGFNRVSLDRVAEAAGLTKGAIYSNFGSKEELLFEVVRRLTPGLDISEELVAAGDLRAVLDRAAKLLVEAVR